MPHASTTSLLATDNCQLTTDLYFIDSAVDDANVLIEEITSENPDAVIIELEKGQGINAMTDIVEQYDDIDSVHILSQGNYAQILLGDDVITANNIDDYSDAFSSWSDNLTHDADILFYGCDIAKEAQGQSVLNQIAEWTGADIAASTDITGSSNHGIHGNNGDIFLSSSSLNPIYSSTEIDFDLEYIIGSIEASIISAVDYNHHLETYTVTETTDDGTGTVAGSLSWAIEQANATTTVDDTINFNLPEGSTISIAGTSLTISDDLTINGNGTTIIFENSDSGLIFDDGNDNTQINITINDLTVETYGNTSPDAESQEGVSPYVSTNENLTIVNSNINDIGYVFAHIPSGSSEIVFINSSIQNVEEIIDDLPKNAEVIYLDSEIDGIQQITNYLATKTEINTVRIISHGNDGYFVLNGEVINNDYFNQNANTIASWRSALSENGDIMLYGCNIAESSEGQIFIANLSNITGADIASSTVPIGYANWDLNYHIGNIDSDQLQVVGYSEYLTSHAMNEFFANAYYLDVGSGSLGQSFIATADGILQSISVAQNPVMGQCSGTLAIYDGQATDTKLGEISITLEGAASVTNLQTFNVFSLNINITNGQQYTFVFENSSYNLDLATNDNLYPGGELYDFGVFYPDSDLNFQVVVEEAPTVDHFSFSIINNGQIAGQNFTTTISAVDSNGSTVTDYSGTVNLTVNSGNISNTSITFTNGTADLTAYVTAATDITITATDQSDPSIFGNSNSFTVTAGDFTQFAFDPIADGQVAGVDFTTTITAQDAYNNTVTDYSGTADLTVNSGSISDTSITFTNGTADLTAYVTAAGSDTITATDQSNPSITDESNSFTVIAGDAASINFNPIPSPSIQAGNTETLTAEAYDAYGNFITNAGAAFTWTTTGGTVTNGDFSATAVGAYTVTAALGSATANAAIAVTPGALDRFAFDPIADGQVAGVDFTTTITAQDAYYNTVTDYSGTADLTVNSGSISDTSITFTNGTADLTAYVTAAGSDTITATDQSNPSITDESNSFTVIAGDAASINFNPIPSPSIQAGNTETLTAEAYDAYGNFITNAGAAFTWTTTGGTVTNGDFSATAVGVYTVTAALGSATANAAIAVTPGALDRFAFDPIADAQVAGVDFTTTITAQDAYYNTVTDYSGTADLTVNSGSISDTSITFTNGTADLTAYVTAAGSDTITATDQSNPSITDDSNSFTVIAGDAASINFNPIPSPSIQAGNTETLTAEAYDAYGNFITNAGAAFTWTTTGGTVTNGDFSATAVGAYTVTAALGSATANAAIAVTPGALDRFAFDPIADGQVAGVDFTTTITAQDAYYNTVTDYSGTADLTVNSGSISDTSITFTNGTTDLTAYVTAAGSDTITATDQSNPSITDDSNSFTVIAGDAASINFNPIPSPSIQAGNTETLTAEAYDAYGNFITNAGAAFTWTTTGGTVTNGDFSATAVGAYTVTAALGSATANAAIAVTPGALDRFAFDPIADGQVAGVDFTTTITAQDAYYNTVTDYSGTADLTVNSGSISDTSITFTNGTADLTAYVTAAGSDTITATDQSDPSITDDSNSFTVTAGAVADVTVTAPSSSIQAGSTETLTAIAADIYGNLVTNTAADFTWAGTQAIDSAVFTETVTGLYTVTATYGIFDDSSTITVNPGTVASVTLTPSTSQTLTSGDTVQFSAIAKDVYSNTITSSAAAFIWSNTNSDGLFINTTAGSYIVTAFYGTVSSSSVSVIVNAIPTPSPTPQPSVDNGMMINDGTSYQTHTSWRNSVDNGPETSINNSEGFEPNEVEGIGLGMNSMITFDLSIEGAVDGEYSVGTGSTSAFMMDGEYGLDGAVAGASGMSDGEYGAGEEGGEEGDEFGSIDLTFNFDGSDELINFEGMAVMAQKHPTFKTELDLLLEKI